MPVSAATGLNMKELMWKAYQVLQETPPLEETQEELPVYRADVDPRAFEIEQIEEDTWLVTGKMVEKQPR